MELFMVTQGIYKGVCVFISYWPSLPVKFSQEDEMCLETLKIEQNQSNHAK